MRNRPFRQRGLIRSICCLLICASSWKGPLPMIHHHAVRDSLSAHREAHLHVFHSEEISDESWHWHIVLPTAAGEPTDDSHHTATIAGDLLMPPAGDSSSHFTMSELRGEFSGWSALMTSLGHFDVSNRRSVSEVLDADRSPLNRMLSRSCLCSVTGVALV
jgi:hypothetical protein